jgi:hypothetical protein
MDSHFTIDLLDLDKRAKFTNRLNHSWGEILDMRSAQNFLKCLETGQEKGAPPRFIGKRLADK